MNSASAAVSRAASALDTARALVNAMELDAAPIERCLMLAQRLARLMRDEDSQRWLDYEQRGYPAELPAGHLGKCSKYAYRFSGVKVVTQASLPQLEATKQACEAMMTKLAPPTMTGVAENFIVAGATMKVLESIDRSMATARNAFVFASTSYSRMRAMLHRWGADTLLALELGDAVEGIFDAARDRVDVFVGAYAPRAAEQLVAVNESMQSGNKESFSLALTSCRRLLANVADAVFPPQPAGRMDRGGKSRSLGPEQYKNRLLAYLEDRELGDGTSAIVAAEHEHLAARLDAVYEKACKGVHAEVDEAEARLVVIQTYLFLAELARYAAPPTQALAAVPEIASA